MWSILLTLCMVLSLLPATALASGSDTGMAVAANYEELVDALQDSTVGADRLSQVADRRKIDNIQSRFI